MVKPTVALIHGWSFENYSGVSDCVNVWDKNQVLIELLTEHFEVVAFNLPGFCFSHLPERAWKLDDFAFYVEDFLTRNAYHPAAVLGFSFGGAVAVRWKSHFNKITPLLLISPALSRVHWPQRVLAALKHVLPVPLLADIKEWVKVRILHDARYARASKFTKETYLNIVTEELSGDLAQLDGHDVRILFGSDDIATPPNLLIKKLPSEWKTRVNVIPGGHHNIIETHREEIVQELVSIIHLSGEQRPVTTPKSDPGDPASLL